jgi:hypothetical protein
MANPLAPQNPSAAPQGSTTVILRFDDSIDLAELTPPMPVDLSSGITSIDLE